MRESLSKKLDYVFWFIMWLFPLIASFIVYFNSSTVDFNIYTQFIRSFTFPFVFSLINQIITAVNWTVAPIIVAYFSYIVCIEILHVLVDIIIFIPRICHKISNPEFWDRRMTK